MHRPAAGPLVLLIIAALLVTAGCTMGTPPLQGGEVPTKSHGAVWKDTPLTDMGGYGNFTISRFSGKTVIVPLVSAGCPSCIPQLNRQIGEAQAVAGKESGRTVVVVLDLDLPTGPDFLSAYGAGKTYTGWSARVPPDLASDIFHRFGPFAIDTQAVPVILVCPDGRDLLLPPGLKTADDLDRAIAAEC